LPGAYKVICDLESHNELLFAALESAKGRASPGLLVLEAKRTAREGHLKALYEEREAALIAEYNQRDREREMEKQRLEKEVSRTTVRSVRRGLG